MKINVSAYIKQKSELDNISKCMDSFCINTKMGTFAIADGVSGSLMSKLWSPIITRRYVENSDCFFMPDFRRINPQLLLTEEFNNVLNEYLSDVDEIGREKIEHQIDRYKPTGGSRATLIGLTIKDKVCYVKTIGDSILYTYFCGQVKFYSSMATNDTINFGNVPECITSDGWLSGNLKEFIFPLQSGYIFMMTDSLAKWFYENMNDIEHIISDFESLDTHESFCEYVNYKQYNCEMDDDDTTLLMLKIEDDNCEKIQCSIKHIDDVKKIESDEYKKLISCLSAKNKDLSKKCEMYASEVSNLKDKIEILSSDNRVLKSRIDNAISELSGK